MLCDNVLIENHKYGYVIMQSHEAMKIVNFTHVQTSESIVSAVTPLLAMNTRYKIKHPANPHVKKYVHQYQQNLMTESHLDARAHVVLCRNNENATCCTARLFLFLGSRM